MKQTNKIHTIIFLMVWAMIFPCRLYAQDELFSQQTPAQETLKNMPIHKADGGTGTGDSTNPGGGTDGTGNQNDVPLADDFMCLLLCLLAAGYGLLTAGYRRFFYHPVETGHAPSLPGDLEVKIN